MMRSNPPTNGNRRIHDAIVMSGWTWENFNTPERVALALAHLGAKVLYCENPSSFFRHGAGPLAEVQRGISRFVPQFLGHRLNHLPIGFQQLQSKMIAKQVLQNASELKLKEPLFFYPHGDFFVPLCREFKRRGFRLVHGCFDYLEAGQERHVELSDVTLTLSKTIFYQLKAKYGDKIAIIPEVTWLPGVGTQEVRAELAQEFSTIPHPRLGYIGPVSNRLNLREVERLLRARPDWHFVHFGEPKCLELPNVHVIKWRHPTELGGILDNLDVGFMPYDCYSNKNFHCMPLKVFDYFLTGLPVVSTPIVNLWEYSDTIYFADDASAMCRAVESALNEPKDGPLKSKRMAIARANSIEALANVLAQVLAPNEKTLHAAV
jgi:hypothetical protein